MIGNLLGLTKEDISDCLSDHGGDRGVDGIYFSESEGDCTLHIFNFKYYDEFNKRKNFSGKEADKIITLVGDLNARKRTLFDGCPPQLREKIHYVLDRITDPSFSMRVYFCSNGDKFLPSERVRVEECSRRNRHFTFLELDAGDIVAKLIRPISSNSYKKCQLYSDQHFERSDGGSASVVATVQASEFLRLIADERSPSSIDPSVFDDNIRLYLGRKNSVNAQILETAMGNARRKFWYMNNGITIVCKDYRYSPEINSPEIRIDGFQIVNGGQTSHALFEAMQNDPQGLKDVFVLLRIHRTQDDQTKIEIAEATNNQTRINSRDLKSNDLIQKKLEIGLRSLGYWYERKKGQHAEREADLRIDALRAGQLMLAYYSGLPEKSKIVSNEIFGELYADVFSDQITPQHIVTVVKLAADVEETRLLAKRQSRDKLTDSEDNEFLIEGYFHVLFALKLICSRERLNLHEYDAVKRHLPGAMKVVQTISRDYRSISFYRFFRSTNARNKIFEKITGEIGRGGQREFPFPEPPP